MPSKSEKQARTMRAAAHDPEFAKKMGIDQDVAKEFVEADKKKAEQSSESLGDKDDDDSDTLIDVGVKDH